MPGAHARLRPAPLRPRGGRTLDQRVALRFPRGAHAINKRVRSLPVGSGLRQRFTKRIVRLGFEAYNRRDFDAILASYDPAVENQIHHVAGIEGIHAGHDGLRHYWRVWFEAWDESRQEVDEIVDFDDDRLLILGRIRCRNKARGMELEEHFGMHLTLRHGRVARHEEWFDQEAALRAAGLGARASASRG